MGFVIGFAIVAAVILLGGGNTLKGLGADLQTTGGALQTTINGRTPTDPGSYNSTQPATQEAVPLLPTRSDGYATGAAQHTIPAVQEEIVQ